MNKFWQATSLHLIAFEEPGERVSYRQIPRAQ